jgi:hypothetical protein
MDLPTFVLSAMTALAPGRDHAALSQAIVATVAEAPALFLDDEDRTKTAALIVAVAFRESGLRASALGDGGRSYCAMQVHASSGGSAALNEDPLACVRAGRRILAESMRVCRAHPVAYYARGGRWDTEEARRISRDRVALARDVRAKVLGSAP